MASTGLQMLGLILAIIGFISTIVVCALPMWRVTAFIGPNIITAQVTWEGLWMNCIFQTTGQLQCKVYDSMLVLPMDLQAARALVVISMGLGIVGLLLGVMGAKCSNLIQDDVAKTKVAIASGVMFILAGVLVLIPVCWTAHTIIQDFYNPLLIDGQRRELGASLFVGWFAAGLLFLGGGLLCSSCPPKEEELYNVKYSQAPQSVARSVDSSKAYV